MGVGRPSSPRPSALPVAGWRCQAARCLMRGSWPRRPPFVRTRQHLLRHLLRQFTLAVEDTDQFKLGCGGRAVVQPRLQFGKIVGGAVGDEQGDRSAGHLVASQERRGRLRRAEPLLNREAARHRPTRQASWTATLPGAIPVGRRLWPKEVPSLDVGERRALRYSWWGLRPKDCYSPGSPVRQVTAPRPTPPSPRRQRRRRERTSATPEAERERKATMANPNWQ